MAYQNVDLETKLSIVKEYQAGKKVTQIAKEYNVSRQSIYDWCNVALDAMKESLIPYQKSELHHLKKRVQQLEEEKRILSEQYSHLTQKTHIEVSASPSQESRPPHCPKCSSTSVIKNGSYSTKTGLKQRFRCKDCGSRIYLVKKNCRYVL